MRVHPLRDAAATPAGGLDESDLHGIVGYQLAQATIATDQIFKERVGDPFGLRPVEYTVMSLIQRNAGGSSARLARALAVTAPNITMWLDRLVQRGLAKRSPNATDRRAQVLALTPEGARIATLATQRLLEGEREAFSQHLSPGEHAILVELLHKVAMARRSKQLPGARAPAPPG
jgi:DNA-binding MarR family transcriptional regulator